MAKSTQRNRLVEDSYCFLDRASSTISIVGEINQRVASSFRRCMRVLERKAHPITVEINSHGGDIEAGLVIIDTMTLCRRRVTTRVTGQACSMAALVLASGDRREALPSATAMVHYGSYSFAARYDEMQTEVAEAVRLEKLCAKILDEATGKKSGYWEKKSKSGNLYMTAEVALTEGLIDRILKPRKQR